HMCAGIGCHLYRSSTFCVFFFFSSRRRHTRSYGDWSSDVCSSDLAAQGRTLMERLVRRAAMALPERSALTLDEHERKLLTEAARSEERRVGKECRSRWATDQ